MIVKLLGSIYNFFSSVKLAVFLIICMSIFFAFGTFYEAEFGTPDAQRVVYKSIYAQILLFTLMLNLASAAIDRLPWKKYHIGFVVTHMGIITVLFGSYVTQERGLDGSLALGVQESADSFTIPETVIQAYQMLDGKPFAILFSEAVDFDRKNPGDYPYEFKLVDGDVVKITKYMAKAKRTSNVVASEEKSKLPSVQFKISNERVSVTEWVSLDPALPPSQDLGPAMISIIMGPLPTPPKPANQVVFFGSDSEKMQVAIFSTQKLSPMKTMPLKKGEKIPTGWMNLELEIIDYIPHSEASLTFSPAPSDSDAGFPVVQATINDNSSWFELGRPHELKGQQNKYFINFTNRREPLGFKIKLDKFKVLTYKGGQLPMGYESTVTVDAEKQTLISMNEPLEKNGFTLYQASFESDEKGQPVTSILSINHDPGRTIKYIGAICVVLGILIMFYWKPRYSRKPRGT